MSTLLGCFWKMVQKKRMHNFLTGCFLTNHFSVLFAEKANIVSNKLKRNLMIYSSQLKDLSNYQAFKHNFSSEESTESAGVPKEWRTIAWGRRMCCFAEWILVVVCAPKADTLTRRLGGGRELVVEKVIPPSRQTPNYYAFLNNCEKSIFIFLKSFALGIWLLPSLTVPPKVWGWW